MKRAPNLISLKAYNQIAVVGHKESRSTFSVPNVSNMLQAFIFRKLALCH